NTPSTATVEESLEIARGRTYIADPPPWFGVIRPSKLLTSPPGTAAADQDLRLEFRGPVDRSDSDDDDDGGTAEDSKTPKLFKNPISPSRTASNFLRKILGSSRSRDPDSAGGELQIGAVRRAPALGPHARPLPTSIRFTDDGKPAATRGIGGALHPEWDV